MFRLLLVTLGCLLIAFGLSGLFMFPKLINNKIEEKIYLKINTPNYDRFTRVPIPVTVKYYIFNITNAAQVMKGAEKPLFEQVGPFVYKQWRRRNVTDFLDNNRKIKYRELKTYFEVPREEFYDAAVQQQQNDVSARDIPQDTTDSGDLQADTTRFPIDVNSRELQQPLYEQQQQSQPIYLDPHETEVTIINLPLLAVLTKVALIESDLKRGIALKLLSRIIKESEEKLFVTQPVSSVLFDGYKVKFMQAASDLIKNKLGFNYDSPLYNDSFGFMYNKNGTWDSESAGELIVFSGRDGSMDKFMQVETWNGRTEHFAWPKLNAENVCNRISGTDGSQFKPGVQRDTILSIFSPMICTSIFIKYKEDTECQGIKLYRFSTPPEVFAAPAKSGHRCYCTIQPSSSLSNNNSNSRSTLATTTDATAQQTTTATTPSRRRPIDDSRCYYDGLMDLSLCQKGAPLAASSPHFLNAEAHLASTAGLKPSRELHETFLDIEPLTGAVMRAASRAQINAYVERAALELIDTQVIGKMPPMVAPILWIEESAEIDEKSAEIFKQKLYNTVQKAHRSFIGALLFGFALIGIAALHLWYVAWYKAESSEAIAKRSAARRKAAESKSRLGRFAGADYGNKRTGGLGGNAKTSNKSIMAAKSVREAGKLEKKLTSQEAKLLMTSAAAAPSPTPTPAPTPTPGTSSGASTSRHSPDDDELSSRALMSGA